jgi:hypothetical protein
MTAVSERGHRRKMVVASALGTVLAAAGIAALTLWRLGMLKGML